MTTKKTAPIPPPGDWRLREADELRAHGVDPAAGLSAQQVSQRALQRVDAVLLTFALQMATIYIPALNPIFKTEPLSLAELGICLAAAFAVYGAVEIEKAWWRSRLSKGAPDNGSDSAADAPDSRY